MNNMVVEKGLRLKNFQEAAIKIKIKKAKINSVYVLSTRK